MPPVITHYRGSFLSILCCLPLLCEAEIVTDGSLGDSYRLSGADMLISADMGRQVGANLFHSFQSFNVNTGESATFSGGAELQNVIARVTGQRPSTVNGVLRNSIAGANTYLLNPAGVILGAGAELEMSGGFHASTANSLVFADQSLFYAAVEQSSQFSSAPPSAFGVLESGTMVLRDGAILSAPSLELQAQTVEMAQSTLTVPPGGELYVHGDNITLHSEARLRSLTDNAQAGAAIRLEAQQQLQIVGHNDNDAAPDTLLSRSTGTGAAGSINLHGAEVRIENTSITAQTQAEGRGADLNITADKRVTLDNSFVFINSEGFMAEAGHGGDVVIRAPNIELRNNSILNAGVMGSSDGGNVMLEAQEDILLGENSHIYADTFLGTGNGGLVSIKGHHISLLDGAFIDTTTKNIGAAGNVTVRASGTLTIGGDNIGDDTVALGRASSISSGTFPLISNTTENLSGLGAGGTLDIQAENLILEDGGYLYNSSLTIFEGGSSAAAGNIVLNVADTARFSGVNPYGETIGGFGSGIYLRSRGQGAGAGGHLQLNTGRLILENGGTIISSTASQNDGGNLNIQVTEQLEISGDASQIELHALGDAQLEYIAIFSPEQVNESVSGIYSRAEVQYPSIGANGDTLVGSGGTIEIQADTVHLSQGTMISTSSTGLGKAGNLQLSARQLILDSGASISSDSTLINTFTFDDAVQRDTQLLLLGGTLVVEDVGSGRSAYYVQTGQQMQRVHYVNSVEDVAALDGLSQNIDLRGGDVVNIESTGERYLYSATRSEHFEWVRLNTHTDITLPNLDAVQTANGWFNGAEGEAPIYPHGTMLQVLDAGDGKSVTFVYAHTPDGTNTSYTFGDALRVRHFNITDVNELDTLNQEVSLINGATARLQNPQDNTVSRFLYQNGAWLELQTPRSVADVSTLNALGWARPGYVSEQNGITYVSSGQDWLLNQNAYRVADLPQRNALPAQEGDIVSVADMGNGQHDSFFYHDGEWQQRTYGGNAGTIVLNIQEDMSLSQDSRITTASLSSGGGSLKLNTQDLLNIRDSQITSSVREGAGNGGDLEINAEFIVQKNAPIIARAVEGNGGNIQINSKGIFKFIPSTSSPIDASSQFGVSGKVELLTPDEQISGSSFIVQGGFLNGAGLALNQCEAIQDVEELNVLKVDMQHPGMHKAPESFQE